MQRLMLSFAVLGLCAGTIQAGAQDYFSESTKDFGTTPRGPILVHYFLLTNSSGQPVTIGTPRVSCGCVSASVIKSQLAAGETTAVVAQMDTRRIPTAGVTRTVTVYVPFLAPQLEEVQLRVSAIARDDLVMTPETLAFGTARKGQGGKTSVRITFYSDPNWTVSAATSTGAYIKPTVSEPLRQGNQVTYDIHAALDPDCPVGNWTADIWLTTNAPGIERLRIPVTVNVVAPIALNPPVLNFGDVRLGAKSEQRVIMQGSAPFRITGVKGAENGITVTPDSDGMRPVHIVTITLTPGAAGALTRQLVVSTDHKEQPQVTVPVTARVGQ